MQDLGSLGGDESQPIAMNALGQVVGFSITASGAEHAFLWASGTMQDLGTLGVDVGQASRAVAINDFGQVAGISFVSTGKHAFLWANGVMQDLGTLGGIGSEAIAIDSLEQVVG